jgi:CDP-paratose 2-epimerase
MSATPVLRSRTHVLVTGGCGFIGCNLVDTLATRGRNVLVLDNLSRAGAAENADWLKARHRSRIAIEVADIRDAAAVRSLVGQAGAVLHLAAQVAVTTSLERPLDDLDINTRGTLNVLESVRLTDPGIPVVFASTNKVYGRLVGDNEIARCGERYVPSVERFGFGVDETTPLDLYSPYGCSKGAADQYVRDYARVFGLRTAVLRMSCIYGPRQFGNEDQGWIAHFLLRSLCGEPITICGDGCQVRDALYVEDAVAAWLGVLDHIDAVAGRVFNLGGGPANTVSLREMIDMIARLHGRRAEIRHAPWRPGDQPWYVSDIRAVSQALAWSPRVSLRDGLAELDRWLVGRFADDFPVRREARA